MAFDAFIQIADIPGEALDEKYSNWIEITGYNFGVNQSTSATASSSGGASSGRTTMTNFTFTKYLDSASCKLMEASCAGQHLKEVKLVLCRAGTDKLICLVALGITTGPGALACTVIGGAAGGWVGGEGGQWVGERIGEYIYEAVSK
ncbi:Uncharacterized protein ALO59_00876 [Pseudomonas amygdali pv. mellea]|uniref:Hcp family type VI secretion system effector n=1 Tax=Pseudomonas amygdali TaxID=47877 RepID=UPI0006E5F100|nr:type VI secretion system tube protein Hcp [Pseudomonas amygdali]KPW38675.1 Uncharacterized protein ALO51_02629 [Pseudomonas amygdali]KPX85404.1 Uncharacterized protein ALO59_00876 [Pseudomonas amygdali pv. mellea]